MGVVYRARHLALDREYALKLISPALSNDPRFRERFQRESRLAASLEHPNLVQVDHAGDEGGSLYLAMRLVEGSDLRRIVEADGPLDLSRAAGVLGGVAAGLDAAHAARPDSPRREAGQRADRGRRRTRARLPDRLRSQQGHGKGRDRHLLRRAPGQPRLHGSRADRGRAGRPPGRHLRAGMPPLLRAHRPAAVPAGQRHGEALRPRQCAAAAALRGDPLPSELARPGRRAGDGGQPGEPLPERGPDGRRPGASRSRRRAAGDAAADTPGAPRGPGRSPAACRGLAAAG